MEQLRSVALLAADTPRARAYVDVLRRRGFEFAEAFLLPGAPGPGAQRQPAPTPLFDNVTPLNISLARHQVPIHALPSPDINDPGNCATIARSHASILTFAAPAGAIVRAPLFSTRKRILHVHPGWLPDYRGSTTIYYSLLTEGTISVTALFLDERIDTGPIIERRRVDLPDDRRRIDTDYDPWIRATLLSDVLQRLFNEGDLTSEPQHREEEDAFYIIHPVLKHLAILAKG